MNDPETALLACLFVFAVLYPLFIAMVARHVRRMRAHRVWMREQFRRVVDG